MTNFNENTNLDDKSSGFDETSSLDAKSANRLRYLESYAYVFEHPKWGMNILLATICQLIPIVGPMVMTGYQFELIESLHRAPRKVYPEFTFDDFVVYLQRGVWPFLVSLVAGFVLAPVILIVIYGGMFGIGMTISAMGEDAAPAVLGVGIPLWILAILVLSAGMQLILLPMILRAGLAQDFSQGFNVGFVIDFISKVWMEILLMVLFMMVSAMAVALIGIAFCFFGVYPATTVILYAQAHFQFQLYELYLARGGEPVPLKPPRVVMAMEANPPSAVGVPLVPPEPYSPPDQEPPPAAGDASNESPPN